MNSTDLNGHKILVTAGSTWVSIDTVRVITNIFKGKIGFTIAEMSTSLGADVTLLLGPSLDISQYKTPENLKIIRFKYFDELDQIMQQQLKDNKFDAVVHSAAVSDFQVSKVFDGKIKSDTAKIILELIPTKKIVDYIKKMSPDTFLVKFKLEVGIGEKQLIEIANKSLKQSNADLIVANIYDSTFSDHEAYLVDPTGKVLKVSGRENIASQVLKEIYDRK